MHNKKISSPHTRTHASTHAHTHARRHADTARTHAPARRGRHGPQIGQGGTQRDAAPAHESRDRAEAGGIQRRQGLEIRLVQCGIAGRSALSTHDPLAESSPRRAECERETHRVLDAVQAEADGFRQGNIDRRVAHDRQATDRRFRSSGGPPCAFHETVLELQEVCTRSLPRGYRLPRGGRRSDTLPLWSPVNGSGLGQHPAGTPYPGSQALSCRDLLAPAEDRIGTAGVADRRDAVGHDQREDRAAKGGEVHVHVPESGDQKLAPGVHDPRCPGEIDLPVGRNGTDLPSDDQHRLISEHLPAFDIHDAHTDESEASRSGIALTW